MTELSRSIPCQDCGAPTAAKRRSKRFCDDCQTRHRGRRPATEKRPDGLTPGAAFLKACYRCGAQIQAVRTSKRFCDGCLADHRKPVREQSRSARAYKLRKFGLTLAEYDAMVVARLGRCDICSTVPANQGGSLCVDHDHESGLVRGLLCSPCNRAIGLLGDTAASVARAAAYLANREELVEIHRRLGGTAPLAVQQQLAIGGIA